mmetsp:Transcript_172/g.684  ORF Transcript_172/g.684 Transcript_172/m.684 type:complete len:223 (+) Transcript_172:860-1528(+)
MHVNVGRVVVSSKVTVITAVSPPPSSHGEFAGSLTVVTAVGNGGVLSMTTSATSAPIHVVSVGQSLAACVALSDAGAPPTPNGAMSLHPPREKASAPLGRYGARPGAYVNVQCVSQFASAANRPDVGNTSIAGLVDAGSASNVAWLPSGPPHVNVTVGCVTHSLATTPTTKPHLGPTILVPLHRRDVPRTTVKVGGVSSAVEKHTTDAASASAPVAGAAYRQ